ncbi:MAG: type IV pilus biogenesis/stability protein PilW [Zoogloeaceae bacterium]|nr:type IV pilus biogenesis/stability protein PilW [Zoogloeaceae bacterium]
MITPFLRILLLLCMGLAFHPAMAQNQQQGGNLNSPRENVPKDPRSRAKIHTELGALYYQDKNIPVAMEELTIAIYIDPTYAPAYSMRALVHYFLKEPQHAEDNFQNALKYAPDDPEIANNYGWFLCQIGKQKEGMPQFERALKNRLYQTPDRAYLNAGQCAMSMGDYAVSEEYLTKAYRVTNGSPVAALRMAELYFKTGRFEQARTEISSVIRKVEPNAEVLWLAIRIERKLGDRDVEMRYTNQLRRSFPTSKEYEELLKGNYE